MTEPSLESRFKALCGIVRAQHFAWRDAVAEVCPDVAAVVNRMWELTGVRTAKAYLERIDRARPLAPQVAAGVVWSSRCMGEDARLEVAPGGREAFVLHADCPWVHWHRRRGLLTEDRTGCDTWFRATVDEINRVLGTDLRVETLATLPEGGAQCVRRFWNG